MLKMRMGRNPLESELQAALLLAAPACLPRVRLFRRNIGKAKKNGYTVQFGITGQCDLYALVRGGRHIEIELKSATGTLEPEQKDWRAWCERWEIPYLLLSGEVGETVKETVERWCGEIRDLI